MRSVLKTMASLKLTCAGIVWLIANAIAISQRPEYAIPWVVLPLSLLALNLLAAIITNRAFRLQSALLVFHVGLLGVLALVAAGVLVRLDAQLELVEGERFDASAVTIKGQGWLHPDRLPHLNFTQGPVEVRYLSGLRRDTTHSSVTVMHSNGVDAVVNIGDRQGFSSHGYRLMTTFNKGFAVLLLWQDANGEESLGAINFPSYPEFEWQQRNSWETPTGEQLMLELKLGERVPESGPWTLVSRNHDYEILVKGAGGETIALAAGDSLDVHGGKITVADLRLWMGYRLDFSPFLSWLLAAAFLTLSALAVHVQQKYASAGVAVRKSPAGRRLPA